MRVFSSSAQCFAILLFMTKAVESEVLVLSARDFDDHVKRTTVMLVQFYGLYKLLRAAHHHDNDQSIAAPMRLLFVRRITFLLRAVSVCISSAMVWQL